MRYRSNTRLADVTPVTWPSKWHAVCQLRQNCGHDADGLQQDICSLLSNLLTEYEAEASFGCMHREIRETAINNAHIKSDAWVTISSSAVSRQHSVHASQRLASSAGTWINLNTTSLWEAVRHKYLWLRDEDSSLCCLSPDAQVTVLNFNGRNANWGAQKWQRRSCRSLSLQPRTLTSNWRRAPADFSPG